MASKKHLLIEVSPAVVPLQPRHQTYGRKAIFVLCGLAVLATGIAAAIGASMVCGKGLSVDVYRPSSSVPSSNSDNLFNVIEARGVLGSATNSIGGIVTTVTRPNKFFGPTISPELAATIKATTGQVSIEKRDPDEVGRVLEEFHNIDPRDFDEVSNVLEGRDNIEKRSIWQPTPGLTWTYQLSQTPSSSQLQYASQYNVWDIDLFDTNVTSIQTIQAAGSRVVCYLSAGTDENWRSDSGKFRSADIGQSMGDWPGENWINTRSTNVRKIMAARLDLAKSKGCDAVDPDNIDAYNHDTGFNLTQTDAVNYVTYLAKQASQRGLAISLKNSGDIIPKVINLVQFSVEEACTEYDECYLYEPFTTAGKAVFHVEYPKGYGTVDTDDVDSSTMSNVCSCIQSYKLSPIVKNNNLDSWQQNC